MLLLVFALSRPVSARDSIGWIGPDQVGDASGAQYAQNTWFYVEAGQAFWIGDYFQYFVNYFAKNGSELPIIWSSSNPSVARVQSSTGLVSVLKEGSAVITGRYQGKAYACTLRVQKKGALKSTTTYKAMNTASLKLCRYYGKKITSKNSLTLMKLAEKFAKASKAGAAGRRAYDEDITRYLVVPTSLRAKAVIMKLREYIERRVPFDHLKYKVSKVTAKKGTNTADVTISRKATLEEVNAASYYNTYYPKIYTFGKTCTVVVYDGFDVYYEDEDGNEVEVSLSAKCRLKAGSRNISCTLYTRNSDYKLKAFKLKKGMQLTTSSGYSGWKNEKSCYIR